MACLLKADPDKKYCARGAAATTPVVFIDGPPTATVTAATFNSAAVPIGPNGRIALTPLNLGTNPLNLTIEGVDEGDEVALVEACDGNTTRMLCKKKVGAAPGNGNPVLNF